jgi:hypothetical protein
MQAYRSRRRRKRCRKKVKSCSPCHRLAGRTPSPTDTVSPAPSKCSLGTQVGRSSREARLQLRLRVMHGHARSRAHLDPLHARALRTSWIVPKPQALNTEERAAGNIPNASFEHEPNGRSVYEAKSYFVSKRHNLVHDLLPDGTDFETSAYSTAICCRNILAGRIIVSASSHANAIQTITRPTHIVPRPASLARAAASEEQGTWQSKIHAGKMRLSSQCWSRASARGFLPTAVRT